MLDTLSHTKWQQIHPVVRDLMVTGIASFASFIAGFALISIFGRLLGVALLGEYLLLRRVAAWLQPLSNLGLGVALPRYVAYSVNRSPACKVEYFQGAVACIISFGVILGSAFSVAHTHLGLLLFGSAEYSYLVLPLFLWIFGWSVQGMVYGFYRGCLNMKRASILQLCTALLPITVSASLFQTRSVALIVTVTGCSFIVVAIVFAFPIFQTVVQTDSRTVATRGIELLKYGLSRVGGDFSSGALLGMAPVVASHYLPLSRVSYLLLGISILTATGISTEPLGLVFLSKISMMLANNRISDVNKYLSFLFSAVIDVSLFMTMQIVVFVDLLVRALIGSQSYDISVIRIVALAIPCYLLFTALRSALDAGSTRPLNAQNVVLSVGVLAVLTVVSTLVPRDFLLNALAWSLVASFSLLAYLTRRSVAKLYHARLRWKESAWPSLCTLAMGAIGMLYHKTSSLSVVMLIPLELVFALIFVSVCFLCRVGWVRVLQSLVFRKLETVSEVT